MPFGKRSWSDKVQSDIAFPIFVLQQPWPAADRLTYLAWARAQASLGSQITAGLVIEPLRELLFLPLAQQVITQGEHQPQRTEQFQEFDEAHAQDGHLSGRG